MSAVSAGGSDAMGEICGGGAAKNPNGLAGGVVLAGININEQLGVRSPPPPPAKAGDDR